MTEHLPLTLRSDDPAELLSIAYLNLLRQGQRSFSPETAGCCYAYGELHCAAGWCFNPTDWDEVSEQIEGRNILQLVALGLAVIPTHLMQLLYDLQGAHDGAYRVPAAVPMLEGFRDTLTYRVARVARNHKLTAAFDLCVAQAVAEGLLPKDKLKEYLTHA